MTHENLEFDTNLGLDSVVAVFRGAIRDRAPQAEVGGINVAEGRSDDIGVYARGKTMVNQWCVQMFVRDDGASRHVQLLVLGSSTVGKVWNGTRSSFSVMAGRAKAAAVIDALKIAQRAAR